MRRFLADPLRCATLAGLLLLAISASEVPMLWIVSFGAFFLSVFALGWHEARPVLIWIIAFNMFSIWADVLLFDLTARGWAVVPPIFRQDDAIYYSACALLFLAIGMRVSLLICAQFGVARSAPMNENAMVATPWSVPRIAFAYFGFIPVAFVSQAIAASVPALSQPLYVFGFLKFVLIYWLAATVFASNRHYLWLTAVMAAELVIGSMGYFSSFKEGFFVVLIALAGSPAPRLSARQFLFAIAGCAVIIYMALVWTVVKQEFRSRSPAKILRHPSVGSRANISAATWMLRCC